MEIKRDYSGIDNTEQAALTPQPQTNAEIVPSKPRLFGRNSIMVPPIDLPHIEVQTNELFRRYSSSSIIGNTSSSNKNSFPQFDDFGHFKNENVSPQKQPEFNSSPRTKKTTISHVNSTESIKEEDEEGSLPSILKKQPEEPSASSSKSSQQPIKTYNRRDSPANLSTSRRNSPANLSILQREQNNQHQRGKTINSYALATPRKPPPSVLNALNKEIDLDEERTKEITNMLNANKVEDLVQFLKRRTCLNKANMLLIYVFHALQSAGIVFTSVSANVDRPQQFILIGLLCQIAASMLSTYQQVNASLSETTLRDIVAIKENTYVDQSVLINDESY